MCIILGLLLNFKYTVKSSFTEQDVHLNYFHSSPVSFTRSLIFLTVKVIRLKLLREFQGQFRIKAPSISLSHISSLEYSTPAKTSEQKAWHSWGTLLITHTPANMHLKVKLPTSNTKWRPINKTNYYIQSTYLKTFSILLVHIKIVYAWPLTQKSIAKTQT